MPSRTRVKICGVTRVEDALLAAGAGADAIGLNFCPSSPRCIAVEAARRIIAALPAGIDVVGVFIGMHPDEIKRIASEAGFASVQLHGREPAESVRQLAPLRVLKAFRWQGDSTRDEIAEYLSACRVHGASLSAILIDTHKAGVPGGTGEIWTWDEAASLSNAEAPLILAGGLKPENVGHAIAALHPYAVDVAGGVESRPGIKNAERIRSFIEAVRAADRAGESNGPG